MKENVFTPTTENLRDLINAVKNNPCFDTEFWLKANPIEPVVIAVGLSDSQLRNLHAENYKNHISDTDFLVRYKMWSKNQTFAQPSEAAKAEIKQLTEQLDEANRLVYEYTEICVFSQKEIEALQLELKAAKEGIQPNWENAPIDSVVSSLTFHFFDKNGKEVGFQAVDTYLRQKQTQLKTIIVNGFEVEDGNYDIEYGEECVFSDPSNIRFYRSLVFSGTNSDKLIRDRGLIYKLGKSQQASKRGAAMLGIDPNGN